MDDAPRTLAVDILANERVRHAVIGVPGRVDYRSGRLEHAPNLPRHWADALDEHLLAERFGVPVSLANDADLAAVGEAGHTVLEHTAALRGEPASFEDLGSGTALGRRAARAGLSPDGARIVALVRDGDPGAIRIWDDLVSVIATGVINVAYLFSPSAVILGGGVGLNGDLLVEPIRQALNGRGPRGLPTPARTECLRQRLVGDRFARVLTSPLRRALETCTIAGFAPVAELRDDGAPGGESPADIARRVDGVVADLLECCEQAANDRSHLGGGP